MDNDIPIHVFELTTENIIKAVAGEKIGTIVR
jgi:uridylate kinase